MKKRNKVYKPIRKSNESYIFTSSDLFQPIKPLQFNEMLNTNHDKLVNRLKSDVILSGAQLVMWNLEYGVRCDNSCIGEIDVLGYWNNHNTMEIFEVKSTYNKKLYYKGKNQLTRIIDNYIDEFNNSFNLPLEIVNTYIVDGYFKSKFEYKFNIHQVDKIKIN